MVLCLQREVVSSSLPSLRAVAASRLEEVGGGEELDRFGAPFRHLSPTQL